MVAESIERRHHIWDFRNSIPSRIKPMSYTMYVWLPSLALSIHNIGKERTAYLSVRIMSLSRISGHGDDSLISQWGGE